jgi:hypothetical protein
VCVCVCVCWGVGVGVFSFNVPRLTIVYKIVFSFAKKENKKVSDDQKADKRLK